LDYDGDATLHFNDFLELTGDVLASKSVIEYENEVEKCKYDGNQDRYKFQAMSAYKATLKRENER